MANGDIDLSVGSVLALSGAVAAVIMKDTDWGPFAAVIGGILSGVVAGLVNGWLTAYVGLPSFIATLGTFYWARGVGSSIVAGTQLNGFPESFNLIGRNFYEDLSYFGIAPQHGVWRAIAEAVSVQTIFVIVVAVVAGVVLAQTPFGQKVYAIGGNERAANFAGINTRRVRFTALVAFGDLRGVRRPHLRRFLPQLHPDRRPVARARRDLLDHHRRRFDLRRLRHDDRLARRRGGDHADPLAAFAADHSSRRQLLRAAAAVAERLHRRDPHLRRHRRHLDPPAQYSRPMVRPQGRGPGAGRANVGDRSVTTPIVEMRGISKAFGPVQALGEVNLKLMPGEVLGLVGDNSAGKSTLMKIMTGAYQRDAGDIFVDGQPVRFKSPHESRDRGIEMIYQDFALCGNLDVGQNIFLGRWPLRLGFFVDHARMHSDARQILNGLKVDVNSVYQKVESLSGGRQQSVAIARAISFNPKVVIFDEPTANLSVPATERLLETIVELRTQGVAQIIISHRLTDIFEVGDRVMVLKRGRNVGTRAIRSTSEREVLELIVSGVPETAEDAELAS